LGKGVVVSKLKDMNEFVKSIDPMSGPNLLRHSSFTDNGDGTMKMHRPIPFGITDKTSGLAMLMAPPDRDTELREQIGASVLESVIALAAKTCQHCKYWERNDHRNKRRGTCNNMDDMLDGDTAVVLFMPSEDFGCNKWDEKE
jgi:hypothetical protein